MRQLANKIEFDVCQIDEMTYLLFTMSTRRQTASAVSTGCTAQAHFLRYLLRGGTLPVLSYTVRTHVVVPKLTMLHGIFRLCLPPPAG